MLKSVLHRCALGLLALTCAASDAYAQPPAKRLLERASEQPPRSQASVAATRRTLARIDTQALASDRIELTLFDDVQVIARQTSRSNPRSGSTLWQGKVEGRNRGEITLALVEGVLSGTATIDGRTFEIGFAGGGLHEIREVSPALFPPEAVPIEADLLSSSGTGTSTSTTKISADASSQIDVMVVWTPAARNAVGGTPAAIQSLIDLAVANANASYGHSQIATSLRLVYSGEVNFTETPSGMTSDLYKLSSTNDGSIDLVHTLRNQYGADIVTLLGSGYASSGYCGVGFLMSSVSTSFAVNAFNVVDQACAAGYLSYAHEVGHNQGLHHDPANAGGTPSYSYAYGLQDPMGAFRTVMSYGGAPRVQHFSNPSVFYGGAPTGTSQQDNAQALNRNASTVANFRSSSTTPCTYAVTPTSMTFSETGGTASIEVSTASGCSWNTNSNANWISVGPGGSGPGSVTVSVATNSGTQRSTTISVAGVAVSISEAAASQPCSYSVTPSSLSFDASGGSTTVNVTTQAGCAWDASSGTSWVDAAGNGTGSGGVSITALQNTGTARSTTITVAGQPVSITQDEPVQANACSYALSTTSLSVPASGGTFQIQVYTTDGCTWSSENGAGWAKVSGTGYGSGWAAVQVNRTSGSRSTTATIAGQNVTITQVGGSKK